MLNLLNIDRIEFVDGSMSTLYGSSAIGGIVNIITKKNDKPFWVNLSLMYDQPLIQSESLSVGFIKNNFYYHYSRVNKNTSFRKQTGKVLWSIWIALIGIIGKIIFWN